MIPSTIGLRISSFFKLPKRWSEPDGWLARPPTALILSWILIGSLLLRLLPALISAESWYNGLGPFGDSYVYHKIAFNLARGNGYSAIDHGAALAQAEAAEQSHVYEPAATRAPLYPTLLAGVYRGFGELESLDSASLQRNFQLVRILQCMLDTLTCLLVFLLTRALFSGAPWPALAAAALYASCPYSIYYTHALLTETLATFLLVLASLVTTIAAIRARILLQVLAGACWGLLALCRPEYLLLVPVLAGFTYYTQRRLQRPWLHAAAVMLGACLIVAPWMARNQQLFDQSFISVGGPGYSLFLGTFESNSNWVGWNQYPDEAFRSDEERARILELDQKYLVALAQGSFAIAAIDDEYRAIATARIMERPFQTLALWVQRAPRLWYQFYIPMYRDREASGNWFLVYLGLAIIALAGATPEQRTRMQLPWLVLFYVVCVYLPLHVEPRYSVPTMPMLICLAGFGMIRLLATNFQKSPPRT